MKVLLAHNFYGSSAPSGENLVFELERDLLSRSGHEVHTFTRHSDDVRGSAFGLLRGALATTWNPWTVRDVRAAVGRWAPDIVHVHNTFPLLSPSIFAGVGARAARVLTLHNYRLFCPAAIPLRGGATCTECLDRKSVRPALRHGCYRNSRLATAPLAASIAFHRALGTWRNQVEAFVALTEFQRELMVEAGLPRERVWVKPNFYPGTPSMVPWAQRGAYAVFAGRLTQEKGVADLVDAWASWGDGAPELRVVGDGGLRTALEERVRRARARVTFLGQVASARAEAEIASARLLVLPSIWFEGFPMVIREAFAFGTPVAASAIGPLPRIVKDGVTGVTFEPGNPVSLLEAVRCAWGDDARMARMSAAARAEFESHYAERANHDILLEIYQAAQDMQRERRT